LATSAARLVVTVATACGVGLWLPSAPSADAHRSASDLQAAADAPGAAPQAGSDSVRHDPAPPKPPPVFYQEASWSADGASLFLSRFEAGRWRIDRIRADGSGRVQLTPGPDCWTSCAPDGKRFAFHSERDDRGEIYVANCDGTGAHAISRNPGRESTPAWSPDGSRIAFVSDRDGRSQVYVMRADGSGQTPLGDGPGVESNPSWSPDGRRLTFYTTEEKVDWLCVVGADGSARRRIAHGAFPSWSPDGGKILYDRDHTLYTISPEGKGETVLVRDAFAGRWSPDGKHIAFIRGRWPASSVYVANADGTGEHALTPPAP
jgi:Tol biopolymer transport system component